VAIGLTRNVGDKTHNTHKTSQEISAYESEKSYFRNIDTVKRTKMESKYNLNSSRNENSITIDSVSEFIYVINNLTKDLKLYKEIINQLIEKIKIKSKETNSEKDWEYYSSFFLVKEANAMFFAFSNLFDKVSCVLKAEIVDLHNKILDTILTYYNNEYIINKIHTFSHDSMQNLVNFPTSGNALPVQVYYRGEASTEWKSLPSVLRERKDKDRESYYYHEIQVRCPWEFKNQTCLNKLVTMQHYEVPTRLLDITSNPLSALFFACESKSEINKDGKVIFFPIMPGSMSYGDSDKALILSCLPHLSNYEQFYLLHEIKNSPSEVYDESNISTQLNKLLLEIRTEKPAFQPRIEFGDILNPLFVQPNMTNPRIINQQGAFILSGLSYDETEAEEKIKARMSQTHIIIPANKKKTILGELDSIGINQATIYPNLDKIAGYLKNL